MSLDTYANLKLAIARWLKRDDLTNDIDDFIDLCESDWGKKLRIRAMEDSTTGALSAGTLALPSGYLQTRRFSISVNGAGKQLDQVTPDQVLGYSTNGEPERLAVLGDNMHFGPAPDGSYTYTHHFYKALTALSGSNTTNWILTNAPDVYLYGALLAAAPFLKNDVRILVWKDLYTNALAAVQTADKEDRYAGPGLRVRVA